MAYSTTGVDNSDQKYLEVMTVPGHKTIRATASTDPNYPGIVIEIEGLAAVLVERTPEGFQVVRFQENSDDPLDIRKWNTTSQES